MEIGMGEQKELAKILMQISIDLIDFDHDYEGDKNLLEMTINNIKHDFGEAMHGDTEIYFKES